MKLPTFSGLARAQACPPSMVLRHTKRTTAAASRGTAGHRFAQRVVEVGRDRALDEADPEDRGVFARWNLARLPADGRDVRAEVPFAINVRTGAARELVGMSGARAYETATDPPGPDEICGTLDVVGLTHDRVWVTDYKLGHARQERARSHAQLRAGAFAAARAFGRDAATVEILRVFDGEPWSDIAELDFLDLEAVLDDLRAIASSAEGLETVERDRLVMHEGPWCDHCPAVLDCPAVERGIALLTRPASEAIPLPMSAEAVGKTWLTLDLLEGALEVARGRVRSALIEGTLIPVAPGKVLAYIRHSKEVVASPAVVQAVAQDLAPDFAHLAVKTEITSSIARLDEIAAALKAKDDRAGVEGSTKAGHKRRLLNELRARHGTKTTGYSKWEVVDEDHKQLTTGKDKDKADAEA